MMPESLVKFGISKALTDFCHDVQQSGRLSIACQMHGVEDIDTGQAISIYRIVQELINNIMKHAKASEAMVQVMRNHGKLSITVEDNGVGFDEAQHTSAGGMGWGNIRSRVSFLKGEIDVRSSATEGTSVHIEWPSGT
jgi:signal transduction histidine kinase